MNQSIKSAAFSLKGYRFDKVQMDLSSLRPDSEYGLSIQPEGVYHPTTGVFDLHFLFVANIEGAPVISINCISQFAFNSIIPLSEIPEYFYANSIAIIFPYIRAFVSTVTLQSNVLPLIIPTLNLSSLQKQLADNTVAVDE